MALRAAMRGSACRKADYAFDGLRRWTHSDSAAPRAPLQSAISIPTTNKLPPLDLPENWSSSGAGVELLNLPGGPMELMAVPKKKVSKHKRGIRNGPKALKPVPVIVHCTVCGRVKLPHFFCCSGVRPNPGDREHSG